MSDAPSKFYVTVNDRPFIYMGLLEADNFIYDLQRESHDGVIKRIRGYKCATVAGLHNEVAAALQFPGYYGENWDAMAECLNDLEWFSGSWYLLHLVRPGSVLPDDDDGFRLFMSILLNASRTWANPGLKGISSERASRPFNIIVSGDEADISRSKRTVDALIPPEA